MDCRKKGITMNVLFFLTPKSEVAHLHEEWTLRQAIEKLERSGYSAIPLIDRQGRYIGTVTEGDILWTLKKRYNMNLKDAENVSILTVTAEWTYVRYLLTLPWKIWCRQP